MSSTMIPPSQQQGGLPGQQQQGVPGGGSVSPLPPTGIQQQLSSLQQFYQQVQGAQTQLGGIGFNPYQYQAQSQQQLQNGGIGSSLPAGQVNIQMLAKQLAQRYGLPLGRGELVDPSGNFLVTPEQLAQASGGSETMGMAAAKMNYISQAIANEQNKQQQAKGIAAMQQGVGLVQSRARGSLAALQSGMYQGIADLYANQEFEGADFSWFIEEERFQLQQELQRRAEKQAKKQAQSQAIAGIGLTIVGAATGNVALIGGGVAMTAGGGTGAGWW